MLTFWSNRKTSLCNGMSRRNFLRVGGLGLGGLTLADILKAQAHAATSSSPSPLAGEGRVRGT
jgi:hypothetical protein